MTEAHRMTDTTSDPNAVAGARVDVLVCRSVPRYAAQIPIAIYQAPEA